MAMRSLQEAGVCHLCIRRHFRASMLAHLICPEACVLNVLHNAKEECSLFVGEACKGR